MELRDYAIIQEGCMSQRLPQTETSGSLSMSQIAEDGYQIPEKATWNVLQTQPFLSDTAASCEFNTAS